MQLLQIIGASILLTGFCQACTAQLTPEQKQVVTDLRQDLDRIRKDIEQGRKEEAAYNPGLLKTLIGMRLEVLKTNEALIEQRIHALESGARITVVVHATTADPEKAAELAKEIESKRAELAEARAEADKYSGGLLQAVSETSVATTRSTIAMLEQQYFVAKYGLAMPTVSASPASPDARPTPITRSVAPQPESPDPTDCIDIETFDSSVLSVNDVFTELAWKVDIPNTCTEAVRVRVTFTLYDTDDFKLDSDFEDVLIPAGGTGKARGTMLVSPPEKARRMAKQGASIALL